MAKSSPFFGRIFSLGKTFFFLPNQITEGFVRVKCHVSGTAKLLSRLSLHGSVIKTIYGDEIIVNIEVFFKSPLKNRTQKLQKKTIMISQ